MIDASPSGVICSTSSLDELRECRVCSLEKLSREFGSEGAVCRRCRSDAERLRRRRKRLRTTARGVRQLAQAEDIPQIHAAASRLVKRFPPQRLAEMFQQLLTAAKPASTVIAHTLLGVLKFRLLAESLPTKIELPETLEAKKRALARELSLFVLENPHTVSGLLTELGWKVEPPEASEHCTADHAA